MTDYVQRAKQYLTPNYRPAPLVFTHGEGMYLYAQDGQRYLDFTAGIAVCALGHNHPHLTRALSDQARQLLHVSNLFINEPAIDLAQRLCEISFADRVYFSNSGAESNEAALKLARRYMQVVRQEDRFEIICATQSFHGRTWAAISATGQPKYHKGFSPLVPGFKHVPYNDLEAMQAVVNEKTCAIMVEPIQGEGGVIEAQSGYLQGLRDLCDREDLVLIFDEVQTGVGRTGNWFAHQHEEVTPDIMCLAKGLGGGVAVGAMLCNERVAGGFAPGVHASTFGGNPLACRAGLVVLDRIEQEGLLAHVQTMGHYMMEQFEHLVHKHSHLIAQRGRGLLRGLVTAEEVDRSEIVAQARAHGLLLTNAGSDTLRFCPPLILGSSHIDEAIEILDKVLQAY
jgi:acetylornithine/N-succinyldiaminopimelate aminotransferase